MNPQHISLARQEIGRPCMLLEPGYKEEKEILDIQVDISEADSRGETIDSLTRKRTQLIESWIERVKKKIADAGEDQEKLAALRNELDRALSYQRLRFDVQSRRH